jgi:Mg/Co/Ni transporter MgtE
MSPRAAWRLEELGFSAYDYVAGKADWTAAGLPTEGQRGRSGLPAYVKTDVVVVAPDTVVAVAIDRARIGQVDTVLVVNSRRVLLGRLRVDRASERLDETVSAVMDEGPGTVRADADPVDLLKRMRARNLSEIPVTDPDGRLLGTIRRTDLEAAEAQSTSPT